MLVMMAVLPWTNYSAGASPFVAVFAGLGVPVAAGIINFVVLTSALSAANSALFSTSRTLFTMAVHNAAPARFAKLSKRLVPHNGLLFSGSVLIICVLLNFFYPSGAFTLITSVATMAFIAVWLILLITHLVFRHQQRQAGNPVGGFPMPLYPLSSIVTIAFFLLVLGMEFIAPATRSAVIGTVIFFIALLIIYQLRQQHQH
jgi:AAT family amino acid transporter